MQLCRTKLPTHGPPVRETGPDYAPQPRLLDRVRDAIRARHYGRRTEKAYVHWIKRYIFFHGKRRHKHVGIGCRIAQDIPAPSRRKALK